ncbi:MAG TPA: hypothetical protein VHL58_10715 [Thermoanaerobaculia bacterium]|nr:hypothetical protein [Thermoanaerobaculia bacterium]
MPLAWLGVIGSLLMIVILPLEGLGLIDGAVVWLSWLPLFVFEVTLGLWLLIKGVTPRNRLLEPARQTV